MKNKVKEIMKLKSMKSLKRVKRVIQGSVWVGMWMMMEVEMPGGVAMGAVVGAGGGAGKVGVSKVGVGSGVVGVEANRVVPKSAGKVYRLEEMGGADGIVMESRMIFGEGLVKVEKKVEKKGGKGEQAGLKSVVGKSVVGKGGVVGGAVVTGEEEALLGALKGYVENGVKGLEEFVGKYPGSEWSGSVKERMGKEYMKRG